MLGNKKFFTESSKNILTNKDKIELSKKYYEKSIR